MIFNIIILMEDIIYTLSSTDYIPKIIFENLIYNGMLTYFKYNPKITDPKLLPDKNKNTKLWEHKIQDNLEIKNYLNCYNFLNNRKLCSIKDYEENIKKNIWFTNFGGDWIAQIQTYHHFINQRFMIIFICI